MTLLGSAPCHCCMAEGVQTHVWEAAALPSGQLISTHHRNQCSSPVTNSVHTHSGDIDFPDPQTTPRPLSMQQRRTFVGLQAKAYTTCEEGSKPSTVRTTSQIRPV